MTAAAVEARLRREGRADAAVLLVAKRIYPTVRLVEWARHLDLDEMDLQHAVKRLKDRQRPVGQRRPVREQRSHRLTELQQMVLDAIDTQGGTVSCRNGHANSKIRALLPEDIDVFRLSNVLKQLDDNGFIRRDVRGRRTFSISRITQHEGEAG